MQGIGLWMRLHQRICPELACFLDEKAAGKALEKATRFQHSWSMAGFIAVGLQWIPLWLWLAQGDAWVGFLLPALGKAWRTGLSIGLLAISTLGANIAFLHFYRRRIRRSLRAQLVRQGMPVCVACGYDVRGQTEPRCPECGEPFSKRLVNLMERRREEKPVGAV